MTAAGALDPNAATPAAAMFTIPMLKAGVSTLNLEDTHVLRTERVVHEG